MIAFIAGLTAASILCAGSSFAQESTGEEVFPVRDNPGSIIDQLKSDAEEKEYLFKFPGAAGPRQSWRDWKAGLYEKYGFKFMAQLTTLYQESSETLTGVDDAAGYDFDLSATWTVHGRDTPTFTMLGIDVFTKDAIGSHVAPLTFFTQYGSLYPGGVAFGEDDPVIGEFWLQQRIKNKFGFRVGKVFPTTAYDFFPFKNYRTDFVDQNNVANTTIPLPLQGIGGFLTYKPNPRAFVRFGLHDANADPHESAFDTYNGELFAIVEAGIDTNLVPGKKGGPPAGHVHVTIWHQDDRVDAGISSGKGISLTASQQFGRLHPWIRYGYADVDIDGPTFAKQMFAVGLAVDKIFGNSNDRISVGYSVVEPPDEALENQTSIDAYYRIQVTPQIQFGPTLGFVFDPALNPDEDRIFVWGLRLRMVL